MSRLVLLMLVLACAGFGWLPGPHPSLSAVESAAVESAPANPVASLLSGLTASDRPGRIAAIQALAKARDPRLVAFLDDYRQGSAYLLAGAVVLVPTIKDKAGIPLDPLTRQPLSAAVPESSLTALDVSGPTPRSWSNGASNASSHRASSRGTSWSGSSPGSSRRASPGGCLNSSSSAICMADRWRPCSRPGASPTS